MVVFTFSAGNNGKNLYQYRRRVQNTEGVKIWKNMLLTAERR